MSDVTKCPGTGCPLKNGCIRFVGAKATGQKYFVKAPYQNGKCDEHLPVSGGDGDDD